MQLHPYVGLHGRFPTDKDHPRDFPAVDGIVVFVGTEADEYGSWAMATVLCADGKHVKRSLEKLETDHAAVVARLASWMPVSRELRIVVSGTGPDVSFVEVEDVNGKSVAPDTMRDRPDGTRELVFFGVGGAS